MHEFSAEALRAIRSVKPKESFNALTVPEAVATLRTYSEAKPDDSTIRGNGPTRVEIRSFGIHA
jgi:hypothetical protein